MSIKKTKNLIVNGEVLELGYYSLRLQEWMNSLWGAPSRISSLESRATDVIEGTPVNAVAAQGTLTIAAQPTAGDTITVGTMSYIFVAGGAGEGEISIGSSLATAKTSILGALNFEDGVNMPNDDVTYAAVFDGNNLVITAKVAGTLGNSIPTTSVFANAGNFFNGETLGTTRTGVNGTIAAPLSILMDATNLYVTRLGNTISEANWKKITLETL